MYPGESQKNKRTDENEKKRILSAAGFIALFILWTAAIKCFDVQSIGPGGSAVGFAALNGFVHELFGVHMLLYVVTDWLGIVPLCFVLGFAGLGLIQLIKRKSLFKVDSDILALGGFYVAVLTVYFLFETVVINYRPVLIDGYLEASYPSSTTMLVMCVIPTAIMQFKVRIKNKLLQKIIFTLAAFTVFMVIGRLVSGVHWFTDIVGGAILSAGLVTLYSGISGTKNHI